MENEGRHSGKREALREILMSSKDHPSAEVLYQRLKPRYPDISLGTVYRNLARFRERGEAVCVATVAGQERFDGCVTPHPHFICERCGSVSDVDLALPKILPEVSIPGKVREYSLTFYGVCDHCM